MDSSTKKRKLTGIGNENEEEEKKKRKRKNKNINKNNTTNAIVSSSSSSLWRNLKPTLRETTLKTVEEQLGFKITGPTPVQKATIPLLLAHKDVAVEACTGSGKTLAFLIPVFEILLRREEPFKLGEIGAVILSPTRELALQTHLVAKNFIEDLNASSPHTVTLAFFIGGISNAPADIRKFRKEGGTIIVATPGRFVDLMNRSPDFKAKSLKSLEILILDEADRLLDMGFQDSLNTLFSSLPKQRRTGLFSATQTEEVEQLVRAGLRNPVRVTVKVENKEAPGERQKTPSSLQNLYLICEVEHKLSRLVDFLSREVIVPKKKCILYFLTCACVDYFWKVLSQLRVVTENKFPLISLHGKVPHKKRPEIYKKFMAAEFGGLITTDLASRGLDIPHVDWIIQFDAPQNPDTFVHRIGRTARMGREGNALVFLTPHEDTYIEFLRLRKIPIRNIEGEDEMEEEEEEEEEAEEGKEKEEILPKRKARPLTCQDITPIVGRMIAKNREMFDKSRIAFVSYVRAYKEHQCNYIFRIQKVDLMKLAWGFCLLEVPRMPELKGKQINYQPPIPNVNISAIPYPDKVRERQRKEKLLRIQTEGTKEERQRRRKEELEEEEDGGDQIEEESEDQEEEEAAAEEEEEMNFSDEEADADDYKALMKEKRLIRKLRNGKISKKLKAQLTALREEEEEEENDEEDEEEVAQVKPQQQWNEAEEGEREEEEEEEEEVVKAQASNGNVQEEKKKKKRSGKKRNRRKKNKKDASSS